MEGTNITISIVTFLIVLFTFMVMGTGLVFGQERSLYLVRLSFFLLLKPLYRLTDIAKSSIPIGTKNKPVINS